MDSYLHAHPVCRHKRILDDTLYKEAIGYWENDNPDLQRAVKVKQNRFAMMRVLTAHLAELSDASWNRLFQENEMELGEIISVLRNIAPNAPAFSPNSLEQQLEHLADQGNATSIAQFNLFVSSGLRLDHPDWAPYATSLQLAALDKSEPSWQFYDALVSAGMPVEPAVQKIMLALRSHSAEPVRALTKDHWSRVPDKEKYPSMSALALAVYLSNDPALAREFIAVANTNERDLIETTGLPVRCGLSKVFGEKAILATLDSPKFDNDYMADWCKRRLKESLK